MVELWRKITASLAVDAAVLKKVLLRVLKALTQGTRAQKGSAERHQKVLL